MLPRTASAQSMHCTSQAASVCTPDFCCRPLACTCLLGSVMHGSGSTMHHQVATTENTASRPIQLADDYMCIAIQCTTSVPKMDTNQTLLVHSQSNKYLQGNWKKMYTKKCLILQCLCQNCCARLRQNAHIKTRSADIYQPHWTCISPVGGWIVHTTVVPAPPRALSVAGLAPFPAPKRLPLAAALSGL